MTCPCSWDFSPSSNSPRSSTAISQPIPSTKVSPTAGSSPSGSLTSSLPRPTTASLPSKASGLRDSQHTLLRRPWDSRFDPVEFSDDRLDLGPQEIGRHQNLGDSGSQTSWQAHCDVLCPARRPGSDSDATTSCGYHTVTDDGLMQLRPQQGPPPPTWPSSSSWPPSPKPTGLVPGRAMSVSRKTPPTTRCICRSIAAFAPCSVRSGCSIPAIARWRPWRRGAEIAASQDFYLTRPAADRSGPGPVRGVGGGRRRWRAPATQLIEIHTAGEEPDRPQRLRVRAA